MSDRKFDLSIIVPTYNRKDKLIPLLKRLTEQSVLVSKTAEVIVVDDGSLDGTESVVSDMIESGQYPLPLRYFNTGLTHIFGVSISRNLGIKNASADYLLFIDDDCIPHDKWAESHYNALSSGKDVVVGNLTYDENQMDNDPGKVLDDCMSRVMSLAEGDNLTELYTGNFSMRRECVDRAGMFDERFARPGEYGYEDTEFGHRLCIAGYKISFSQEALAFTLPNQEIASVEREVMRKKGKRTWWYITRNPQENLPITPLLKDYAAKKEAELSALLAQKEGL